MEEFIREICWADWTNRCYNGISVSEGEDVFFRRLQNLYNNALLSLDGHQMLDSIISECEHLQRFFDPPTDELLQSIMDDYRNTGHQSLKDDYEYLVFVRKCMQIQVDFLNKFKNAVHGAPVEQVEEQKEVVHGVKGLADHLGIGTTKAQAILNTRILERHGIASMVGNRWVINTKKLDDALEKTPDLLKIRQLT